MVLSDATEEACNASGKTFDEADCHNYLFSWTGDSVSSANTPKAKAVAGMLAGAVRSHTLAIELLSQGRAAEACRISTRALQTLCRDMQVMERCRCRPADLLYCLLPPAIGWPVSI